MKPRKPKKPDAAAIAAALPLTARRPVDPVGVCNVCGHTAEDLRVWREHDSRDRPIEGDGALVYIGHDDAHRACMKTMSDHPRLYAEIMGAPGHFPICGPCTHRAAFACRHPKLKANGGPGVLVKLNLAYPKGAIICPPPPGPRARAYTCEGLDDAKPTA